MQVAHRPAERVLVAGVRAFERLDGAALPLVLLPGSRR